MLASCPVDDFVSAILLQLFLLRGLWIFELMFLHPQPALSEIELNGDI